MSLSNKNILDSISIKEGNNISFQNNNNNNILLVPSSNGDNLNFVVNNNNVFTVSKDGPKNIEENSNVIQNGFITNNNCLSNGSMLIQGNQISSILGAETSYAYFEDLNKPIFNSSYIRTVYFKSPFSNTYKKGDVLTIPSMNNQSITIDSINVFNSNTYAVKLSSPIIPKQITGTITSISITIGEISLLNINGLNLNKDEFPVGTSLRIIDNNGSVYEILAITKATGSSNNLNINFINQYYSNINISSNVSIYIISPGENISLQFSQCNAFGLTLANNTLSARTVNDTVNMTGPLINLEANSFKSKSVVSIGEGNSSNTFEFFKFDTTSTDRQFGAPIITGGQLSSEEVYGVKVNILGIPLYLKLYPQNT